MNTLNKSACLVSSITKSHTRDLPKPNEDYVYYDTDRKIFILLDGITRVHEEYDQKPNHSAACDVNEIFVGALCSYFDRYIDCQDDIESLLREAVRYANLEIAQYRAQKSLAEWGFYPGTLGIIAYIKENRLHYICAGDCIGVLLRENARICFGEQYTVTASDMYNPSKQARYATYCNHPENALSYTIFNGDDNVADLCEYAYIDLQENDVILLASDGMRSYVRFEKPLVLKALSVETMMGLSAEYDKPPFASYADDKAIIKIQIQ